MLNLNENRQKVSVFKNFSRTDPRFDQWECRDRNHLILTANRSGQWWDVLFLPIKMSLFDLSTNESELSVTSQLFLSKVSRGNHLGAFLPQIFSILSILSKLFCSRVLFSNSWTPQGKFNTPFFNQLFRKSVDFGVLVTPSSIAPFVLSVGHVGCAWRRHRSTFLTQKKPELFRVKIFFN
jgi:hypothetical protein